MGKSYTDAQARATKEYLKTLASISIRVLKSIDEKIVKDGLE